MAGMSSSLIIQPPVAIEAGALQAKGGVQEVADSKLVAS